MKGSRRGAGTSGGDLGTARRALEAPALAFPRAGCGQRRPQRPRDSRAMWQWKAQGLSPRQRPRPQHPQRPPCERQQRVCHPEPESPAASSVLASRAPRRARSPRRRRVAGRACAGRRRARRRRLCCLREARREGLGASAHRKRGETAGRVRVASSARRAMLAADRVCRGSAAARGRARPAQSRC